MQTLKDKVILITGANRGNGKYAMLKATGLKDWLNYEKAMQKTLLSIKRASVDIIDLLYKGVCTTQ